MSEGPVSHSQAFPKMYLGKGQSHLCGSPSVHVLWPFSGEASGEAGYRGRCPAQEGGQALGANGVGGQALEDTGPGTEHLSSVSVTGKTFGWGPVLPDGQNKWPDSGLEVLGLHPAQSSSITVLGCAFVWKTSGCPVAGRLLSWVWSLAVMTLDVTVSAWTSCLTCCSCSLFSPLPSAM